MVSAEPGFELLEIADLAQSESVALTAILDTSIEDLSVDGLPEGPTRSALEAFQLKHGHRGIREGEIAAPRWREEPGLMFATIRSHIGASFDSRERRRAQNRRRETAEAELKRAVPLAMRPLIDRLLEVVRHFTRMREHLRSYVVEVLGVFRNVSLEASRRIAAGEPEAGHDAAFYLTVDELTEVLLQDRQSVALVVQQRRTQHARNAALPDPPSTFVGFPPLHEDVAIVATSLFGLPASGGQCEGRVRVLRRASDAREFQAGEVLVVPAADTGWSPLFLAAAAVVTELGGPLSHAAIILREYAVPAVVNVSSATRVLRTGDRVRVNGDSGVVDLLDG